MTQQLENMSKETNCKNKNSLEEFIIKYKWAEERISEHEDRSNEVIWPEKEEKAMQKNKKSSREL